MIIISHKTKNLFIVFQFILLCLISFLFYRSKNSLYKIKNDEDRITIETDKMIFVQPFDNGSYWIVDKKNNLEIRFAYDDDGMNILAITENDLGRKYRFSWNKFDNDRERRLYEIIYKDKDYLLEQTLHTGDPYLIARHERYAEIDKLYILYADGKKEERDY